MNEPRVRSIYSSDGYNFDEGYWHIQYTIATDMLVAKHVEYSSEATDKEIAQRVKEASDIKFSDEVSTILVPTDEVSDFYGVKEFISGETSVDPMYIKILSIDIVREKVHNSNDMAMLLRLTDEELRVFRLFFLDSRLPVDKFIEFYNNGTEYDNLREYMIVNVPVEVLTDWLLEEDVGQVVESDFNHVYASCDGDAVYEYRS